MKKTYNSPATKVIMITQHHMIAESVIVGNNYNGSADIEVKENFFSSDDVWNDDWDE